MKRKHASNRPIKFSAILLCLAFALSIMALPVSAADRTPQPGAAFRYEHDPRLNARAMADIVVDPTAVYGFAPSPEGSLSGYASFDWSDPELVNGKNGRLARIAYHESINEMYAMMNAMRIEGKGIEEIARAISSKRNEIRLASFADDPEGLAVAKARNMEKYGHEEGPLPDELYKQYGSWETVLEKAFSTNSGMDACLGLYDDYYELYVMAGQVEDEHTAAASREYAVAAFVDAAGIFLPDGTDALSVFTDAETSSTYYTPELAAAVEKGILNGYSDHTLRPQNTISRVEAMVLLSRCLPELGKTSDAISFTDVPAWAKREIDRLSAAGLVLGYGDGTLGASDDLTVEQVKILTERVAANLTAPISDEVRLSDDASDFVLLTDAVPEAILEIRYYSTYNFVGDRIDGYEEPVALLTREAAAALKEVSDELLAMGYRLKIFDAYRPQKAVTHFMNWALDTDDVRMKEYFYPELDKDVLFPQGYIAEHSSHSRGSTVDLTLFDMRTEKEVDMGGTFDYFGERSHPDYTGISAQQYENRMLLCGVMLKHGFKPLEEEWWHFTLEDEPYPDTYFTFPVCRESIAGNYTDGMKFDDGIDLSEEDGADSVERDGDHADSPYFRHPDFYHLESTNSLTILPHFRTIQQSSEWSCGVACALMVLEWYGHRGDYTEESLAALRPQGLEPGATSLSEMVAMFEGVGGFQCYSTMDAGEDVYEIFTFDYIQKTLAVGNPILIGWNDWGGHWQVIIGYDTMGTETTQDDVIIVADPYDTTDHNQDGYGIYGAERFLYNFTFYNYFEGEELNDMCFLVATPK